MAWTILTSGACEEPRPAQLGPAASLLVDEPPVAAGDPFDVVLFVRAPQGHRVHGYVVPALTGLEVIDRRVVPTQVEAGAAVHREVLVARTLDAGAAEWPASEIQLTDQAGATFAIALPALRFDVPSVFGEDAPPPRPRGYRPAPEPPARGGFALGLATGLCAAGLAAWLRTRRRDARAADAQSAGEAQVGSGAVFGSPGRLARELEAARRRADEASEAAAADAARALRQWAADRFAVPTHAASSEDLRAQAAPAGGVGEWRAFTERLADLEATRFVASPGSDAARSATAASLDRALAFARSLERSRPGTPTP